MSLVETPDAAVDDAERPELGALVASQLRRIRRIVDAAVRLAEQGGFEGVRLRDVADSSGVALGTLYKYFRSKEDVLLFALNEEAEALERVLVERPARGAAPAERLIDLFDRATRGFTRRPNFARAALRAVSSGDQAMAVQQAGFHLRMARMSIAAMRGEPPDLSKPLAEPLGTPRERQIALILDHVWFAALIGWNGGLHPVRAVSERVGGTIRFLLEGGPEAG